MLNSVLDGRFPVRCGLPWPHAWRTDAGLFDIEQRVMDTRARGAAHPRPACALLVFDYHGGLDMETGDIIIFSSGFGHAAMAYDGRQAIHGNATNNFHLVNLEEEKSGSMSYFAESGLVYRPPWDKIGLAAKETYQAKLRENADIIRKSAKYGLYRAVRLFVGDSTYGPRACERLMKYRGRIQSNKDKVIEKITCSEAVILCFQLTFLEHGGPGFIKLDAAHAMPGTLAKWLKANWGEPVKG